MNTFQVSERIKSEHGFVVAKPSIDIVGNSTEIRRIIKKNKDRLRSIFPDAQFEIRRSSENREGEILISTDSLDSTKKLEGIIEELGALFNEILTNEAIEEIRFVPETMLSPRVKTEVTDTVKRFNLGQDIDSEEYLLPNLPVVCDHPGNTKVLDIGKRISSESQDSVLKFICIGIPSTSTISNHFEIEYIIDLEYFDIEEGEYGQNVPLKITLISPLYLTDTVGNKSEILKKGKVKVEEVK